MSLRSLLLATALLLPAAATAQDTAPQAVPATLAGHAILPAQTFLVPPADAPALFATSGKFTEPGRVLRELYAVEGISFLADKAAPRSTGLFLPFVGQPVQGFSSIKSLGEGRFLVLVDNGFGSKANSADALLQFHIVEPDWESGRVKLAESHFLHDPDRVLPFRLVTEATETRYLTGADLDIESIQPVGESLWFGDEFGPYLIETDKSGRVLSFHEVAVEGKPVRSPDHHAAALPAVPGETVFQVRRSRGFEGMAQAVDGSKLYPLFEGPLWDETARAWENKDGREYLRIIAFDLAGRSLTDEGWKYLLEENGNNIGDFNMIDETRGLVLERDNGEGEATLACENAARSDCFNVPARFKRVYLVDFAQADAEGFVKKVAYIDLLNIQDPDGVARQGGRDGVFTFPFVTIEDVDLVDERHIVVANDNNLPYSSGRTLGRQDDNEFILLEVGDFLQRK